MSGQKIADYPPSSVEDTDQSKSKPPEKDLPKIIIESKKDSWLIDWKELWLYKDVFYFLVLRDITVVYKQTILGFAWAIIRPLFSMVLFSLVFGRMVKVPTDGIPYPIFSYVALLPWTYFSSAMTASTMSLLTDSKLFTKVYFPRLIIPMTPVLAKLLDFAIASIMLGGMMAWYGTMPNINILFLPFLLILMVLTASGVGMWLSALSIQYRDIKHAAPFVTQLLMYAAPVVWPASLIPDKYRLLYGLYPIAGVIEGFRSALLGRTSMPWDLIVIGTISASLIAFSGAIYFRRKEDVFADVA
ncbi:ABC transporter permease [bacterium]|nr:ABC transporter permease [bacterium]